LAPARRVRRPHTTVSAPQIMPGDEQIIAQAHAGGIRIFAATLLPVRGAHHWTPAGEATRRRLRPAFDSGDHRYPNAAGYPAMADAVRLTALLSVAASEPA
jgi:hypothetical protein